MKRCRAENADCGLATGRSFFQGAFKCLCCELCCEEPGFCRECMCLLCCKALKPSLEENFTIRCLHRISQAGICGHAAHLHCALDSQMAGVVKLYGLDMEYLCRRCDKKTELKDTISHLIEGMAKGNAKPYAEKMLKLALRTIQGSQRASHETKLLERTARWALHKIKRGEDIETLLKPAASELKAEDGLLQSKKSLVGVKGCCQLLFPKQNLAIPSSFETPNPAASTALIVSDAHPTPMESFATGPSLGLRHEGNEMVREEMSGHLAPHSDGTFETLLHKSLQQLVEDNHTTTTNTTWESEKAPGAIGLYASAKCKETSVKPSAIAQLRINGNITECKQAEHNGPVSLGTATELSASQVIMLVPDAIQSFDVHQILQFHENSTFGTADDLSGPGSYMTHKACAEASSHSLEIATLPSKVVLNSQFDRDIQDALQKLENRHLEKFSLTKHNLVTKKKEVMDQLQQLKSAKHDLAMLAPSISEEEVGILVEEIVSQAACLEKERVMFEELLWRCRKVD